MSWLWLIPAFIAGFYLGFIIFVFISAERADDWTEEQNVEQHNDYYRHRQ